MSPSIEPPISEYADIPSSKSRGVHTYAIIHG